MKQLKTDQKGSGTILLSLAIVVSVSVGALLGWVLNDALDDDDGSLGPDEPYLPVIDPSKFNNIVDNEFFPLTPGTKTVYEATTDNGLEHTEVTVLTETKVVMGVTCVIVRDTVSVEGVVTEDTYDWYAQDDEGNVWYMGEDTKEYDNGEVISTAGSWEAGIDGAMPGIVMLADPQVGLSYRQEYYEGEAEDMAQVVSLNESAVVQYDSFQNLLMTSEWSPLEPGLVEHKYYAEGIGVVLELTVKGGSERVELVQVIH
jgi:hypothetical protein